MNSDTVVYPTNVTDHLEHDPTNLLSESPVIGVIIAVFLGILCLLTVFGNAVVLHAIRTERRLQTVSIYSDLFLNFNYMNFYWHFLYSMLYYDYVIILKTNLYYFCDLMCCMNTEIRVIQSNWELQ